MERQSYRPDQEAVAPKGLVGRALDRIAQSRADRTPRVTREQTLAQNSRLAEARSAQLALLHDVFTRDAFEMEGESIEQPTGVLLVRDLENRDELPPEEVALIDKATAIFHGLSPRDRWKVYHTLTNGIEAPADADAY